MANTIAPAWVPPAVQMATGRVPVVAPQVILNSDPRAGLDIPGTISEAEAAQRGIAVPQPPAPAVPQLPQAVQAIPQPAPDPAQLAQAAAAAPVPPPDAAPAAAPAAPTGKLALMLEAERRGILPADKQALLTEARARGLVPPLDPSQPQVIPDTSPNYGLDIPGTTTQATIDQQKAASDEANAPGSGLAENAVAGLKNGLISLMSAPGWAYQTAANAGAAMAAANSGADVDKSIPFPNADGGRSVIVNLLKQVGISDPNDTKAKSLAEKMLRSFGENASLVAAPEAILPKLLNTMKDAGIVGDDAVKLATAITGEGSTGRQVLKDATVGGGFGAGTVAANAGVDALPIPDQVKEPLKAVTGLVGGLAGGMLTHAALAAPGVVLGKGAQIARDIVAPLTEGGRDTIVGNKLTKAATDAKATISALATPQEGVDGSQLTTAQKSGDMGLLSEERKAATQDPVPFQQRRADQNEARVGAVTDIQPAGASEAVITSLRDHLKAIDDASTADIAAAHAKSEADIAAAHQAGQADVAAATQQAQAHAEATGQPVPPDAAGEALRASYEAARAATKTNERAVWEAVDPHGTVALHTAGTKTAAERIASEIPSTAKPPEGEEAAIFKAATSLPDTAKLSEVSALQSRVKEQMRAEVRVNGETPSFRRLTQLNNALQKDLETAVADEVSHEHAMVDAGVMRPEDTIAHRLEAYGNNYYAIGETQPLARGGDGGRSVPGEGSPAVPGVRGATSNAGPRSEAGAGHQGLPPVETLTPNLDEATLARLNAARAATRDRVETFDNPTLKPLRERNSARVGDSSVPGRIFHPGAKSFDDVNTYRAAVGDGEALKTLEGYAIDRLHRAAMREDGTLDPAKVATWRRGHADALRAFPELDARITRASASSEAMKEAVARAKASAAAAEAKGKTDVAAVERKAKDAESDAESGAIGKIVKADGPEEVVNHIGTVFARADRAREMARIRAATKGDKDAQEGLRKAVVDFMLKKFVGNAESGTSGVSTIKADAFQTFVRENEHTLRAAGFIDDEIHTLKLVAADLRAANRSIVAIKLPGGPGTAQDLHATAPGRVRSLLQYLAVPLLTEGGAEVLHAPGWGLALGAAGGIVAAVRGAGLKKVDQLLRDALLDPELALKLMKKVAPKDVVPAAKGFIEALRPSRIVSALAGDRPAKQPRRQGIR